MGSRFQYLAPLVDAFEESAVVISFADLSIIHANEVFLRKRGISLESVRGRGCYEVLHGIGRPCEGADCPCPVRKAAETGKTTTMFHSHADGRGGTVLVELTAVPVLDESGEVGCAVEIIKGEENLSRIQDDLRRKTDFLENIMHACPEGIIGNDREGNIFLFNSSAERIFGHSRRDVIGRLNVRDLYPPGRAREVREFLVSEEYGGRGRLIDFETECVRSQGQVFPIRLCCTVVHEDAQEVGVIGFFTDITLRKMMEDRFLESEERLRGMFETAGDAIVSFDEDGRITMANRAAEEMLGYGGGELAGGSVTDLFPAKYHDHWGEIRRYAACEPGQPARKAIDLPALKKSGDEIPAQMSLSEKSVRGKKTHTLIIRDMSERKALEEELRLLSITDGLTQLYNRRHFQSLGQKEIERVARTKDPLSVMLIDVDKFKGYNDSYGHNEGDNVLRVLAERVRKNFRNIDSTFRLGGEEFIVLLPETTAEGAMVAAERLRARFSEEKFHPASGKEAVSLTVSIGVAEHRDGQTLSDLVQAADIAMYAAKNAGRNRVVRYDRIAPRPAP